MYYFVKSQLIMSQMFNSSPSETVILVNEKQHNKRKEKEKKKTKKRKKTNHIVSTLKKSFA